MGFVDVRHPTTLSSGAGVTRVLERRARLETGDLGRDDASQVIESFVCGAYVGGCNQDL